jgi:hypothetical protein
MNLTEEIYQARNDVQRAAELAVRYWQSDESARSQIELLVKAAVVASVISTSEAERKRALAARCNLLI